MTVSLVWVQVAKELRSLQLAYFERPASVLDAGHLDVPPCAPAHLQRMLAGRHVATSHLDVPASQGGVSTAPPAVSRAPVAPVAKDAFGEESTRPGAHRQRGLADPPRMADPFLRMSLLASREHLCINSTVRVAPDRYTPEALPVLCELKREPYPHIIVTCVELLPCSCPGATVHHTQRLPHLAP